MQSWIVYAIMSMVFAGVTAILAKYGLQNVSADFWLGCQNYDYILNCDNNKCRWR
jgi:uncharacterized membrane protein